MARTATGESVVTRVVRVLEAFDDRHRSLSVARLAERAGLPVGTAHRIVGQLVAAGLLERQDCGAVSLGVRMWELAALAPDSADLRVAAVPVLSGLAGATGAHAVLMVLDHRDVVVVEHVAHPTAPRGLGLRAGRRIPAHAPAGGLVLLAHLPADRRAALLRAPLAHYTPSTPVEPGVLAARLDAVRRQGWAVADGHVDPDVLAVAVPVRDPAAQVIAALSVVGDTHVLRPAELVPRLRRGCRDVEAALATGATAAELPVRRLAPHRGR